MELIYNELEILQRDNVLIDCYRDYIHSESLTGFISSFNEFYMCIHMVSENGIADGVSVVRISDITRIAYGGSARRNINTIYAKNRQNPRMFIIEKGMTSFLDVIKFMIQHFEYISIYTETIKDGMVFIGKLKNIDEDYILIDSYGSYNSLEISSTIIRISEITRIDSGGLYENNIHWLINHFH